MSIVHCQLSIKFQFIEPQNDTERVRAEATTNQVRHDLAAGTAGHDLAARAAGLQFIKCTIFFDSDVI